MGTSGESHCAILTAQVWHCFTIGLAGKAQVDNPDPNDIPEPSLLAILGVGLIILGRRQFRRR
ncbi:PEP-CTERM sorting domain-containing protein [Aliiglaciecola lipolytica]|uniref:Ice-binding protein C-terminal domain-containing protein n=1 Tax=Aliiglaciecola lipolytica E3 TaxID=1127673 RepID=K6Y9S9_9ALTE|nr:PEP-CTERM sorting domain-containing protein [Aliiglaciecola lipolytica]GAC13403.1 hypothetical protein GLIP_0757 [Aliiglaciecola lipolytica E3]